MPGHSYKLVGRERRHPENKRGTREDATTKGGAQPYDRGSATTKGVAVEIRLRTAMTCKGVMIPQDRDSTPYGTGRSTDGSDGQ